MGRAEEVQEVRELFHNLKAKTTSFNIGINLLRDRLNNGEDTAEVMTLMEAALGRVNEEWKKLKERFAPGSGNGGAEGNVA